jgi:hypothetical protein
MAIKTVLVLAAWTAVGAATIGATMALSMMLIPPPEPPLEAQSPDFEDYTPDVLVFDPADPPVDPAAVAPAEAAALDPELDPRELSSAADIAGGQSESGMLEFDSGLFFRNHLHEGGAHPLCLDRF